MQTLLIVCQWMEQIVIFSATAVTEILKFLQLAPWETFFPHFEVFAISAIFPTSSLWTTQINLEFAYFSQAYLMMRHFLFCSFNCHPLFNISTPPNDVTHRWPTLFLIPSPIDLTSSSPFLSKYLISFWIWCNFVSN